MSSSTAARATTRRARGDDDETRDVDADRAAIARAREDAMTRARCVMWMEVSRGYKGVGRPPLHPQKSHRDAHAVMESETPRSVVEINRSRPTVLAAAVGR